jgi:hypothetical protein
MADSVIAGGESLDPTLNKQPQSLKELLAICKKATEGMAHFVQMIYHDLDVNSDLSMAKKDASAFTIGNLAHLFVKQMYIYSAIITIFFLVLIQLMGSFRL